MGALFGMLGRARWRATRKVHFPPLMDIGHSPGGRSLTVLPAYDT